MKTSIERRIEKLEKQASIGKTELIITIREFSFESISGNPVKRKPDTCPGCEAKIEEARKTAINGVVVKVCPADCPNMESKRKDN